MTLNLPTGHVKVLHRQLDNFEVLISVAHNDKSKYCNQIAAVGIEAMFTYTYPPEEMFIDSIQKILHMAMTTVLEAATVELQVDVAERGKNAIN